MKVSTEIDNNFGYEKITQLVDNIPLRYKFILIYVLFNDTHLQLLQQPLSLYKQK
jgi:hypothetical protein